MGRTKTDEMLSALRAEKVDTWFDLGLLIDRVREDRDVPGPRVSGDFDAFKREVACGIAFVNFYYSVDGVSMEIAKHARAFRNILPQARIHYIAGEFTDFADNVIDVNSQWHRIEAMNGFDACPLYRDFFERKLERGAPLYNALIRRFWEAALALCERLGEIVERNDIRLLYMANVCSNPGNPALALAAVLVSEYLRIPVINNCHDFFWEGGHGEVEREVQGIPRGPRDHFFTNAHVGEVFSIVEMLYPWDSRSWLTVCINRSQVGTLCERFGLNPAGLAQIGTAIDVDRYAPLTRRRTTEAWSQVAETLQSSRSRLQAVAANDVLERGLLGAERRRPLLIAGRRQTHVDFVHGNLVLLQPTRIIARKRIEMSFRLITRLFDDEEFFATFCNDDSRKLTLLVTGPVALGHDAYLERVVRDFGRCVEKLDPLVRDRVYLALLFSAFDEPAFRECHERPVGMAELYGVASLVVLPSETEGRGLPIIESAACGVPILTRRYEPKDVFAEVIGESLAREDRLDVNAFSGARFEDQTVARIKDRLLTPDREGEMSRHNRRVVIRRYSMEVLTGDLEEILHRLHLQLQPGKRFLVRAQAALDDFSERVRAGGPQLTALLPAEYREYLPGYGRMGFMLMLKSLIDPSYFRIEEQRLRGMAFAFARRLMEQCTGDSAESGLAALAGFYNSVDSLFLYREGEVPIQIDHSLAYRHRNRRHYPYRELTPQELTGVITLLHREMFGPPASVMVEEETSHELADWHGMVMRCCGGEIALDDRDRLRHRLGENVPIVLFLGALTEHELEVFVLQTARMRLGLGIHDELSAERRRRIDSLALITIIERREALPGGVNAAALEKYLASGVDQELEYLYKRGVCRVVTSDQLSVGIDFRQLGDEAVNALVAIRDAGGFVVALCEQAAMTTDGVALERYHIGRAADPLTANILGIAEGTGYVQWAPAGLRPTLAYPTPVQTAKGLSEALRGRRFQRLCKRLGEDMVLKTLSDDAERRGSPVEQVLARLASSQRSPRRVVEYQALNGVYVDGCPWSGVIATLVTNRPVHYAILSSKKGNQTVPEFVRQFNQSSRRRARFAWNGGYILNAELVGKLGLPESYIGSPLGLIVSRGRVLSPPLFNKPAFVVGEDRSLSIRRVSCAGGLRAKAVRAALELGPESRNPATPGNAPCFYDLLYAGVTLPGDGRTIVRLVGNRIMEVHETGPGEEVPILPVGLVFSFPAGALPTDWKKGRALTLEVSGLAGVDAAVEAGPMLLENGEICIDMELEGWKTHNSIATQAARLDYLDMRGPKIAIGLDGDGKLTGLAVNGRIRESVGATHVEMAEILRRGDMRNAMGFDPGGSATLVVGTEPLNISPYNRDYERNVYALPPQPRAVANAIVCY